MATRLRLPEHVAVRRPALRTAVLMLALAAAPFSGCNCDDSLGQLKGSVVVEPASLDFGRVPIDTTKLLKIMIRNRGTYRLDVIGYSAGAPFIAPTRTASIGTGTTIEVAVGFRPTALGQKNGELQIMTNDKAAPVVKVALVGVGIQAAIKVEPMMVDFGEVLFRSVTPTTHQAVKVSNPGTDSFELTAIDLPENGGGAFGLDPRSVRKIYAPGDSETFDVSFLPRAMGAVSGSVKLVTTAPDSANIVVPLQGKAVGPVLQICSSVASAVEQCTPSVDRPRMEFVTDPNVRVDGRIRLRNTGDRDLNLSEVGAPPGIRGFLFNPMIPSANTFVVRPGQESVFAVTFAPTDYLFQSFVVSFPSDSALQSGSLVQVEGRVRQPTIRVIPELATITLGGTIRHGDATIAISNCGTMALALSSITLRQPSGPLGITGVPAGVRMIPPQNCAMDPPGQMFTVTFDPTSNGMFTGAVDIASNDPARRNVVVSIRATKNP